MGCDGSLEGLALGNGSLSLSFLPFLPLPLGLTEGGFVFLGLIVVDLIFLGLTVADFIFLGIIVTDLVFSGHVPTGPIW